MEPPAYGNTTTDKKLDPNGAESPPKPGVGTFGDDASLRSGQDILSLQDIDPALNMKMHLVNNVSLNIK